MRCTRRSLRRRGQSAREHVEFRLPQALRRPIDDVLSRACAKGLLRWSDEQGFLALV
jgi:hypothetical protein